MSMYDLIASYLSDEPRIVGRTWPSHRATFNTAVETAAKADYDGHIENAVYKDIKSIIDSSLERAFSRIVDQHLHGNWNELSDVVREFHDTVHFSLSVNKVAAAHRKAIRVASDDPYVVEATAFLVCALPLAGMFTRLKRMAEDYLNVKRQERQSRPEKPTGYVSPPVSNDYQSLVVALLEDVTEVAYDRLRSYIYSDITTNLNLYMKETSGQITPHRFFVKVRKSPDSVMATIVDRLVSKKNGFYVQVKGHETIIMQIATEQADEYRRFFVCKNFNKIASIIEGKHGYQNARVVNHSVSLHGMEGEFYFNFSDGSHFSVVNKTVMVVNGNGLRFLRHPLTFHDVVLPNGRKMNKPSQLRMNEIFAKA